MNAGAVPLSALGTEARLLGAGRTAAISLGTGIACGIAITAAAAAIRRLAPETLPGLLHPPSIPAALLASAAASVGEEVLCRLFLLGVLLAVLPPSRAGAAAAVVLSALVFGALHAPSWVFPLRRPGPDAGGLLGLARGAQRHRRGGLRASSTSVAGSRRRSSGTSGRTSSGTPPPGSPDEAAPPAARASGTGIGSNL